MSWVGTGSEFWYARVEMFVDDDSDALVSATFASLSRLLVHGQSSGFGTCATDQGTGAATPVIGMCFTVAGDDPGAAVETAVGVARQALGDEGRQLYGVTVVAQLAAPTEPPEGFPSLDD